MLRRLVSIVTPLKPLLFTALAAYSLSRLQSLLAAYSETVDLQSAAIAGKNAELAALAENVGSLVDDVMAKRAELAAVERCCAERKSQPDLPDPVAGPQVYEFLFATPEDSTQEDEQD